MLDSGIRTLVVEPSRFPTQLDEHWTKERNRNLAAKVWQRVLSESPDCPISDDYGRGFLDGFADHLLLGGSGQAPALPPRDYWRLESRDGRGGQQIDDWFAGFRHGAATAGHGSFRDGEEIPAGFLLPFSDQEFGDEEHWSAGNHEEAGFETAFDDYPLEDTREYQQDHQEQRPEPEIDLEEVAPELEPITPPEPDEGWRRHGPKDET